ncbi:MAG: Trk system potassium transporter TrkA, partial [Myxococcales bacterium]|nr:Trk system potassium transporter TrkA [Myxococcales bacterium]
ASQEILDKAGVRTSDLVVAVTDHDEVNLIAALAAKQLGAKRVIARAQGDEWAQWTEGVRYGLLGVDVVINPRVLVAQEFAKIARSHGASHVVDLAQDRIELVQLDLCSPRMTNRPLSKIDMPEQTLIAAVVRDGELFVPGGADVLLEGDRIYLIGKPGEVMNAEDHFSTRREARRVVIVGGGVVGYALARDLTAQNAQVLLIEQSLARAEKLSAELDGITVVHGDGTDRALLEEEEVGTYDLFIAVTNLDEVNLMASLIAQRIGVSRTAALVQRADHIPIYRELGIEIALSPRSVASDHILRFSRTGQVHSLSVLEDGQAEVVELTAVAGCRAIATPLRRLNLPRGALLAAICRQDSVRIPHGNDEVQPGDRVILLATQSARPTVERLFRAREQ